MYLVGLHIYVVIIVAITIIIIIIIIIIIGTKITNQCYKDYSRLEVVSHWLFRYAQELAPYAREWEKLLDACEIKTTFDEKFGHYIHNPQKSGKFCTVAQQFGSTCMEKHDESGFFWKIHSSVILSNVGELLCAFS